jgi:hypothetical protein
MQDPRRYIRYILPGLTFVIETVLYLYLSDPIWVKNKFRVIAHLPGGGIGVLLTAFLLSGGIGYLFSIIYYTGYGFEWSWIEKFCGSHRSMVVYAEKHQYIRLHAEDEIKEERSINDITRRGTWCIANALWHERLETSLKVKGAHPGVITRAHIAHGLGISLFGAILAFWVWLGLHNEINHYPLNSDISYVRWSILVIVIIVILFCHSITYRHAIITAYDVANKILLGVLREESGKGLRPIIVLVNKGNLKKHLVTSKPDN